MYPLMDTSNLEHSSRFSRVVSDTLELTTFLMIVGLDEDPSIAILVHLISYFINGPLAFSSGIVCHDKTNVEESFLDVDNPRGGALGSKRKKDSS